jgi:UDP:flavonoid glycosyltransferase YjiC (YdhE family)
MTGDRGEVVWAGRFLVVGWEGGGNLPPLLGLCRMLVASGHRARALVWGSSPERVEAAGCEYIPIDGFTFDLGARRWEGQADDSLFVGRSIADLVLEQAHGWPADVVIVDCLLRSALCGAEATGLPTAAFLHVQRAFLEIPSEDDPGGGWDFPAVAELRSALDLEPLRVNAGPAVLQLQARCALALSVMPREFERPDLEIPENVRHVGPIFEETSSTWPDDLPWPPDEGSFVVIGLGTTYMHQEAILERILRALKPLGHRILVTPGTSHGALRPDEVMDGPWEVRAYVPHIGVFPHAELVVTHAGMGTAMASLAFGVPMLCLPMERDQFANAERIEALDAGRSLGLDATEAEIARAIQEVLTLEQIRVGCRRMAEVVASYRGGERAVRELRSVLPD